MRTYALIESYDQDYLSTNSVRSLLLGEGDYIGNFFVNVYWDLNEPPFEVVKELVVKRVLS